MELTQIVIVFQLTDLNKWLPLLGKKVLLEKEKHISNAGLSLSCVLDIAVGKSYSGKDQISSHTNKYGAVLAVDWHLICRTLRLVFSWVFILWNVKNIPLYVQFSPFQLSGAFLKCWNWGSPVCIDCFVSLGKQCISPLTPFIAHL